MNRIPSSLIVATFAMVGTAQLSLAALQPGYAVIDNVHVDIAMPLIRSNVNDPGTWQPHIHTGSYGANGWRNYAPDTAVLVVNSTTQTIRPNSGELATSAYDFLGVAPGDSMYRLSSSLVPGQLYLGVEADYAATPASGNATPYPTRMLSSTFSSGASNWGTWDPDGSGGSAYGNSTSDRYVAISLKAVRYSPNPYATSATVDAASQGAFVSAWSFDMFEEVRIWVANSDGITDADAFHEYVRSHSHYNWAFSLPGFYEIDLQARTYYGTGGGVLAGTEAVSPVSTFHFSVRPVPEPASAASVVLGGAMMLRRRGR